MEQIRNDSYADQFDEIEVIGQGAFGKVTMARKKPQLGGGIYAIKEIDVSSMVDPQASINSTLAEISFLKDLSNGQGGACDPNVVCYYDIFRDPSRNNDLFIVTEYIEGAELQDIYQQFSDEVNLASIYGKDNLKTRFILYTLKYILSALAYIHAHGIVHGDIKPENIRVRTSVETSDENVKEDEIILDDYTDDFAVTIESEERQTITRATHRPVLVDFGLSCRLNESLNAADSCNKASGSPIFVAPEVARKHTIIAESDLWSLGITVVALYTDATDPWHQPNDITVADYLGIISDPATPAPTLDSSDEFLNNLVATMLEYNPSDRTTASDLYQSVVAYLNEL